MSAHWEKVDPADYQPRSYEYRDLTSIVDELARASGRARRKRLREAIDQRPPEEVVPLLALELSECTDAKRFDRVARALAQVGGSEAMEVLARHSRTQRRFPGLAIHALSHCADDHVVPLLMDLAEFGRYQQRVSSLRALGRMKEIRSVETLGRLSKNKQDSLWYEATTALRRKGGPAKLVPRILLDTEFDTATRVRCLLAIEGDFVGWRRFDAERQLERILRMRDPHNPLLAPARETLDLLRAHATLLRATVGEPGGSLLRHSATSTVDDSVLLRPSGSRPSLNPESSGIVAWMRSMVVAVKRALHWT